MKNIRLKRAGVKVPITSSIDPNTKIGYGTRINGRIIIDGGGGCVIGKYCAIGKNVHIFTVNHNVTLLNLNVALNNKLGVKGSLTVKNQVLVGNNVWVGSYARILPGVRIGDGAVIGAAAVVTKDVPAYSVAAGNPAKVKKYRFEDDVLSNVRAIKWWRWPEEKLHDNLGLFSIDFSVDEVDLSAFVSNTDES